jgi:hypothetical protein
MPPILGVPSRLDQRETAEDLEPQEDQSTDLVFAGPAPFADAGALGVSDKNGANGIFQAAPGLNINGNKFP